MNDWNMTKLNDLERKVGQRSSQLSPGEVNQLKDEILSTRAAANFFGAPDDMVRAKLMSISNRLEEPDYYSTQTGFLDFDLQPRHMVGFFPLITGIGLIIFGSIRVAHIPTATLPEDVIVRDTNQVCFTPGFILLILGLAIMNYRALGKGASNLAEPIKSSTLVETLRNKLSRMSKPQKILIGILLVMDVILFGVFAAIILG